MFLRPLVSIHPHFDCDILHAENPDRGTGIAGNLRPYRGVDSATHLSLSGLLFKAWCRTQELGGSDKHSALFRVLRYHACKRRFGDIGIRLCREDLAGQIGPLSVQRGASRPFQLATGQNSQGIIALLPPGVMPGLKPTGLSLWQMRGDVSSYTEINSRKQF